MGKFSKVSEDLNEKFNKVLNQTTIPKWIEFELRSDDKQNKLIKVVKLNELMLVLTNGIQFAVIINETIFEQLDDENQEMVIHECLAGVSVSDTDAVSYTQPDFTTYKGVLQKYGSDSIIAMKEIVESLYDAKKQQEDEIKAQAKK